MDLSMILSPAVEEEAPPAAPPQDEPDRKWSPDELQCAVAILQDFQEPADAPAATTKVSYQDVKQEHQRYSDENNFKQQQEPQDGKTPAALRLDDEVQAISTRNVAKEAKAKQNSANPAGWGDDSVSKLDLLVQADAVIKRRRSQSPSPPTEKKPEYVRSGVWSRAEEEYAAALMSYFLQGLLDLPEGTTLRKFLAEKLCCNRRRVSMKLATETLANQKIPRKVGASVFVAAQPPPSDEDKQEVKRVLNELRRASFRSALSSGHLDDGKEHDVRSQRRLFSDDDEEEDGHNFRLRQKATAERKRKAAGCSTYKTKRGKPTIIRTGFESPEEEEYVTTLFEYFMAGVLDLPEGTKLVNYLCQQLGCTPKQLSMKLAPRRMGERKFPDNVGSITYIRKETGEASPVGFNGDDFSEELFEVESRLNELRVACEEAHKNVPPPPVATPSKCERKTSAASISSTGTASVTSTPNASPVRYFRRSGPWSREEEIYAASLIDCFFKGVLDIAEGTTLRAFLASRLCCNPMRISKKLASECIADIRIPKKLGSSTFVLRGEVTSEEQAETEEALRSLQHAYLHSKDDPVVGSKRPRSYRSRIPRSRQAFAATATESDATESDSDARSVTSTSTYGKSPEKLLKSEKMHSPGQEARRQRFDTAAATIAPAGPERVVPAALKQQLA